MDKFDDLNLIVFKIINDTTEAELIKGKLESNNIPVMLRGESVIGAYTIPVKSLGEIKILIKKEDLEKAKEVFAV